MTGIAGLSTLRQVSASLRIPFRFVALLVANVRKEKLEGDVGGSKATPTVRC